MTQTKHALSRQEQNAIRALGLIFLSRQLGLYMLLPVLSLYASRLTGSTSLLIGLSLGVYGGMQAFLQVPFGYLSDRIGRKRAIDIGLILFAVGSLLGAGARSAWLLVIARAIQGSAAISAVVLALIADVTREEVRTQAMGRMGAWIGITIGFSMVIGPTIAGLFGVPLIFILSAGGAVLSMVYLHAAVPNPSKIVPEESLHSKEVLAVLHQTPMLLVDIGIFLLHMVVTVLFVMLPFELERALGPGRVWVILTPAIAIGLVTMTLVSRHSDRHGRIGLFLNLGALILGLSCLPFALMGRAPSMALVGLPVFAVAIAILEPVLATLLSRYSPGPARGTASGVYSMAQFLGAFIGGVAGGAFLHRVGYLFVGLFVMAGAWALAIVRLAPAASARGPE